MERYRLTVPNSLPKVPSLKNVPTTQALLIDAPDSKGLAEQ